MYIIFLYGCSTNSSWDNAKEAGKTGTSGLQDSLKQMDSLLDLNKIRNNPFARSLAHRAFSMAVKTNDPVSKTKAFEMLGLAYSYTDKDSSYLFYKEALLDAQNNRITKELPGIYYSLAMLSTDANNYSGAISLLDSCRRLAAGNKQYKDLANAYNSLGNIYFDVKNFTLSHSMYDSSYRISVKFSYPLQAGVALANLAKFDSALDISLVKYYTALNYMKTKPGSEEEIALLYNNIAYRHTNADSVLFYSEKAIGLAKAHTLPAVEMGAYNNMAYAYLDKKNISKAETCLKEMAIPIALKYENIDWQASLYDSYADVLAAKGNDTEALKYEKDAYKLKEKAQIKFASRQVRLLAVILEVKEKEEMIWQKDKSLRARTANLQLTIFIIIVLLLAIAIFILAFSGYTVRNRLQYQKLLAESAKKLIRLEESDKARVAAEIHDIAGLLLHTKANLIEISETEDRKVNNGFTHELGLLSERLRLLSHRISPALEHDLDFQEIITGLCNDLTSLSGITFHLNMKQPDYGLSDDQKVQIYRIIQELLINGVKYVKSGNIDLSLESQLGNFFVFYRDEGPGFDLEFIKDKGLGIHNIFERCKFLGGIASLKTVPGNGTEWTISIPLIKK